MKICLNAAALLSVVPEACAAGSASAASCCAALSSTALQSKVIYPDSAAYQKSVQSYFAVNAQLEPTCIVQPHSAEDVSLAVSTLAQDDLTEPCQFAVRSGGHTTWAGAADIESGVTIDLSMMNSTTYNPENSTVSILPGARWQSVYQTLDPLGIAVPGGRAGPVGVGGLTTGGGNSFFAARYGFVCDNVENFEVVLASGEIVNANNQTNSDLFKALKGGSNNFGIVTKINLYAFQQGDLWGGIVSYDNSTTSQQITAIVNFTNRVVEDAYASLITFWQYSSTIGANIVINAFEYTKPVANPPAYEEFLRIDNTSSTMRITNLTALTTEVAQASGFRDLFLTLTFANDARVMQKAVDIHNVMIEQAKGSARSAEWTIVTMFQPLPALFSQHSVERGGNMLGLERFKNNLLLFLFDLSWQDSGDDDLFRRIGDTMISQMTEYAKIIKADNEYIYLNYADESQNPLRSYGAKNLDDVRRVANKYDPAGVFQSQVPGGFKANSA